MKIIYQTATGIAIIHPTGELSLEEVAAKDVPAGVPYRIVNDDEVPSDRTFRNAWKDEGGIKVDMPKAVNITKDRLRAERAPLLAALDVEFLLALEAENQKKQREIRERKQYLRDLPQDIRFVAAQTPGDLLAIKIDRLGMCPQRKLPTTAYQRGICD